ncbi:beta-phosphoglucomutase family hydrolase [Deinococcus peraridilitoris]|nr:beta-phosphoglucomutase family hydrolase [Deinococcus peraridilitoris]
MTRRPAGDAFALIFDMDGVIADTVEYHYQSWQRLADEEGIVFSRPDNDRLLGRSRREALGVLLGARTLSETEEQAWMRRKQDYFLEALTRSDFGPDHALPGVRELLSEARLHGVPTGLASSSRNVTIVLEMLALQSAFDVVADASVVANLKPAPDVFVWVAGRLGFPPRQCVVFEDAPAGVQAALSGGFQVVGLGPVSRVGAAHRVLTDLGGSRLADFAPPWPGPSGTETGGNLLS